MAGACPKRDGGGQARQAPASLPPYNVCIRLRMRKEEGTRSQRLRRDSLSPLHPLNGKRAPRQGLGLRKPVRGLKQRRQIVQADGHLGMAGAEAGSHSLPMLI
jgi:hypothetical protein